jgi:hypothetical protein
MAAHQIAFGEMHGQTAAERPLMYMLAGGSDLQI